MTLTWRTNALAEHHRSLGASLEEPWNGMPTAWAYGDDIDHRYVAVRTKTGLMDVSGLNIVHVVGSHAQRVIQRAITRDIRKIYPGKASYATVSSTNEEFRGIAQHQHRKGKERYRLYGVELDSDHSAEAGDQVLDSDGHDIGVVTCGMYSPLTQRSLALESGFRA